LNASFLAKERTNTVPNTWTLSYLDAQEESENILLSAMGSEICKIWAFVYFMLKPMAPYKIPSLSKFYRYFTAMWTEENLKIIFLSSHLTMQ